MLHSVSTNAYLLVYMRLMCECILYGCLKLLSEVYAIKKLGFLIVIIYDCMDTSLEKGFSTL